MAPDGPAEAGPAPRAEALAALDADRWALLLPHLRAVVQTIPDDRVDERTRTLRQLPTGKLAGGRARRALAEIVTGDPALWAQVRDRVADDQPVPDELTWVITDPFEAAEASTSSGQSAAQRPPKDRERVRALREERDAARRQAAGAEARARAAIEERDAVRADLERLTEQARSLEDAVSDAKKERQRAVERERRRRDAEVAELEEQLAALRRTAEQERAERRRAVERDQAQATQRRQAASHDRQGPDRLMRLVPGRPSRLPDGVAPDTTEAVEAFLHRGRKVLVDGYNLTLLHRPQLDLERQRAWLIQTLANLARQRGIQPIVVFDGARSRGGHRSGGGREVAVRFTDEGITADDEIVLEVESIDDPVLVVTDDRELAARCRAGQADVIGTRPFLWVAA